MASCRSTSFYLAPGVYRRFSQYALAAVLPTGEYVEISHRRMVKEIMREHPLWDGLVLCVNRSVLGKSSIVDTLLNKPASVERWYVDDRVIEGRRPTGRAYTLHRLAHGGVETIGGLQQAMVGLFAASDPSVRRAAVKLIEEAGRGAAYRISVALAAHGFLDAHTIANLLRARTPYEHATFAPIDVESTRTAFAVIQARYPYEYQSCISQMLDGSTLGPKWLGEYFSLRYAEAGLGEFRYRAQQGKYAWMLVSKMYGLGVGHGRNVPLYDADVPAALRNRYRLTNEDELAARTRLTSYVTQLASGASLPEPEVILRMLREQPESVPHSVLYDPRLMSDPVTAHQLIVGLVGRTKPGTSRGEGGGPTATLGKPYPIYAQDGDETSLYEAVMHHNFTDETVESLLTELHNQRDRERRRVLGGVLQIALYNGALTPEGMERLYTRLRALRAEPGSLEARLVEALLARGDLPVAIGEVHVRGHMGEVDDVMRAVLSTRISGFGGGWVAYPRKQTTDTYSALGVAFSNPHLIAASPYLREQARTFVQVGLHTAGIAGELSTKYGNGESLAGRGEPLQSFIERESRVADTRKTKRGAETVLQDVAVGLLTCASGDEGERGEALRAYTEGRHKVAKTTKNSLLYTSETMITEHFSVYQPSKPCSTLEELWRDYCSVHTGDISLDSLKRWYANVAVNPHVGAGLRKLAYEQADRLHSHDVLDNDIVDNRGEYEHLHFLERVVGAREVDDGMREAALERHLEKQPTYIWAPSPYGGLALAAQIVSDQSATEKMLALVITGLETQVVKITKNLALGKFNHDNEQLVNEAQEIDVVLHMIEGRSLTGEAAAAWRRCEKLRSELREKVAVCVKKSAEREAANHNVYSDEHLRQLALVNGAVVASLDETRLEEMLTIVERERVAAEHGGKAERIVWPEQITGIKDLPGYGHLPFTGIEEFSERIDGSDYTFPEASEGAAKLSRVATVSSGGELRQNAEYMGNCTAGYARSIARGLTRIVAVYDTDGNCILNLSFERQGQNAGCPPQYRSLVSEILTRLNEDGDGWGLTEINTRFNELGFRGENDWDLDWVYNEPVPAEPLLAMGNESEAEKRAWAIQERFDNEH